MMQEDVTNWFDENKKYISMRIEDVRIKLAKMIEESGIEEDLSKEQIDQHWDEINRLRTAMKIPPSLESISNAFGLSEFEEQILLVCIAAELDSEVRGLLVQIQSGTSQYPTFSLMLNLYENAHWSSFAPNSPLRFWRMIEMTSDGPLMTRPLKVDERILHHVTGVSYLDDRLKGMLSTHDFPANITPSQAELIGKLRAVLRRTYATRQLPVIQLLGDDRGAKLDIAAITAAEEKTSLYILRMNDIPIDPVEREALARLWEREVVLSGAYLLIDCTEASATDLHRNLLPFLEINRAPVFLALEQPQQQTINRTCVYYDVNKPNEAEQIGLWKTVFKDVGKDQLVEFDKLTMHFSFDSQKIISAAGEAINLNVDKDGLIENKTLWDVCRRHARTSLDGLAQRIVPKADWDELVLPNDQIEILKQIAMHMRQRATVYKTWGFERKFSRGLGVSALFAGPSGTGKTMAAEVLANELQLDLYRIDLSQVVSKYIGETEKNLGRVFHAAEESGAILLFDEADALFGKRSEVKDSHDRYANIEIGYLLQSMEEYRGLAVLTTNLKESLDSAFMRRIRFVINFAFPDAGHREEIWRHMFPADTPVNGLNIPKLARLSLTGGSIRNIAMNAAFIAADQVESINMEHILLAAKSEYAKLDRKLPTTDIRGWRE